jgi:4-hydroxy-3-methylbut-2-enyl diphosphate reductase
VSEQLVVCAALRIEARAARSGLPGFSVSHVGMRARSATGRLGTGGPVALIGFGGGLSPDATVGDVVVASEIVAVGAAPIPCAGATLLADLLRARGVTVQLAPIAASTRIVHGAARAQLAAATGAVAVDMESAVVGTQTLGRPFAVVRVIVDTPERRLTRLSTPIDGWHGYRTLREIARALPGWAAQLDSTNATQSLTDQRVS